MGFSAPNVGQAYNDITHGYIQAPVNGLPSATATNALPWGPGGIENTTIPTGGAPFGGTGNPLAGTSLSSLWAGGGTPWQAGGSSFSTGKGTPWAAEPSAPSYQQVPAFNESNYTTPNYSAVTQAGQQQIAANLAAQNGNILAQQQSQGSLNSGSTGQGLAQALQGGQQAQSNLAGQVGQMQMGNALQQYQDQVNQINAQNQNAYNSYATSMQNYNQNKQGYEGLGGTAVGLAAALM